MELEVLVSYALLSFGSLFAMLNPFNTVPPFLAMTMESAVADQISMARRASSVALGVMVLFALFGITILNFFGISVPAFQIAGGLVILRVSFEMLQGNRAVKVSEAEREEGSEKDDISITPLAVPILCGPGSITTAVLLGSEAETWVHTGILVAILIVIYAGTFVLLRFACVHARVFGEITLKIISRLMGLLLIALAIQFILDGIRDSGLAGG